MLHNDPWKTAVSSRSNRGATLTLMRNGVPMTGFYSLGKQVSPENDQPRRNIRSSEQFIWATLDTIPFEICVLDEEGVIIATNKSWRDFAQINGLLFPCHGEGSNYLRVCDDAQGVSDGDAVEFAAGIRRVIRGELTDFSREYPCHSLTERRWFIAKVSKLPGQEPIRVVVSHENITHLKLTEESLRESRDNYRMFFETIDDLIFISALDGAILYTNPAVCRKLGYDSEELSRMKILDLHPDSCREEAGEILAAMFSGERDLCPLPLRKQDGGLLPVETRIWRGRWDGREVIYGISKDMSSLQAAHDKFQKIFEHNPTPLAISTADTGQFVGVNEALRRTIGYTSDEILGRTASDLGLFPDAAAQRQAARLLFETGLLDAYELTVQTKDGKQRTGIFSGTTINDQGSTLFLTVMSDITERKRFEEELIQARSLAEAANLAKSAFLTTMSHELRTPLNSILGMCEVLLDQDISLAAEKQRRYLTIIDESGRHLLTLINDILDLSRIEADKLDLSIEPLSLEDLCRSCLTFIREMAIKKRIALSMTQLRIPERFNSDQRRLKQILINLLGNAVKFTPEEGEVCLEVIGDAEQREIRFIVRDTGIGISPDDMKKLFKPFVQVDSTLSRRYDGTGLGLTLVKRLVELLGGRVEAESEPGQGSRFAVILPWRDSEAEPEPTL